MFGALVRTATADNVALQGLYFEPDKAHVDHVAIHVHGSLGNFYENPFIDHFADFYVGRGIGFLAVNTRGHDVGGITERFEDSVADIEAWLQFAWARGYRHVWLQGHSLGAFKATYFTSVATVADPSISGLVLLAPFDVVAFYCQNEPASLPLRLQEARLVAARDANEVMPNGFFDTWPISAGTFIDLVANGSRADVFPFRNDTLKGTMLDQVQLPVFAAIGSGDVAQYPSPAACISQLKEIDAVTAVLVDEAPHNFAGHEAELLQALATWLDKHQLLGAKADRG